MKKLFFIIGLILAATFVSLYFNKAGGKTETREEERTKNSLNHLIVADNQPESQSEIYTSSFSPRSGGWQLQVMPSMPNRLVRDIYFTDSIIGYAVASPDNVLDSAHILKTTDGGFNWNIKYTSPGRLPRIIFINSNTGFAGGNKLLKTTNAGDTWNIIDKVFGTIVRDMAVFGEDTTWYSDSDPFAGTYRTTNGGINWEKRDNGIPGNSYPDRIYFYNSRIGFAYHIGSSYGFKTTDSGNNWFQTDSGFIDIHFLDSLNGWRSWNSNGIQRTTNGGNNWYDLSFPNVPGLITNKQILEFNVINNDTMYAVGAYVQRQDFSYRAIIYKTTNRGLNWVYLYPDTGFVMIRLTALYTINSNVWAYSQYNNKGIYSATGGGTTNLNSISEENPEVYELYQNYPNPFNQLTIISYQLSRRGGSSTSNVKIKIFDLTGKEITVLYEGNKLPGTYEIRYDAGSLGSGVYFYQLIVDNEIVKTRKMILLK